MGTGVSCKKEGSLDMTFSSFYEVYKNNLHGRLRKSTWLTKESIIKAGSLEPIICDFGQADLLLCV